MTMSCMIGGAEFDADGWITSVISIRPSYRWRLQEWLGSAGAGHPMFGRLFS